MRKKGRGRASTGSMHVEKGKNFFSFLFFTCCRSLAAQAMTLPYMAEFDTDSNMSLFCLLLVERRRVREGEGKRMSAIGRIRLFHRVGLVFSIFGFRVFSLFL